MIITCPHCQTKYQVTYEAIGSAGRKVQCAHCNRAWQQTPSEDDDDPDRLFDARSEEEMDKALASEAGLFAAEQALRSNALDQPRAPIPDTARAPLPLPSAMTDDSELRKRQKAFSRRQNALFSTLPVARLRRAARIVAALGLAGLIALGYFGRYELVTRYPDLAGLYGSIGLATNVMGLEFAALQSQRALSAGNEVLTVSAQIVGISPRPVKVPPVVISLLDDQGMPVYEWSVTPSVADLMVGERATFDTRLTLPPSQATTVRLSFTGGAGSGRHSGTATSADETKTAQPVLPETPAEPISDQQDHPEAHQAPAAAAHH
ncbi:MAG: zinc-ribbon domain-containing protein [Devosia sp.]|uniref:MJ0042-type zinc finger domain-containing protein n=1 Tax=Devosia sp. TaxID=1871048 RepID=UPI0024CA05E6|nr:MJ0042-type zinc finger domain-containing protein [Devosia sp.]UYN98446.1 MAG: zinc-ribbon domain-containing protein [Devosia sp.]